MNELRPDTPESVTTETSVVTEDDNFYKLINERGRSKSSLSLDSLVMDEDGKTYRHPKYDSYTEKSSIQLNNLIEKIIGSNDCYKIIFDEYYQNMHMEYNAFLLLIKGHQIDKFRSHVSRYSFNILPWRCNFNGHKYQLDKCLINSKKYKSNPDLYFQSVKEYYDWLIDFCNINCEVIPFKLKNDNIIFLPIISPMWFVNGNQKFKQVENFGYINLGSSISIEIELSKWLSEYTSQILEKYNTANKLFNEKKSFIVPKDQEKYKGVLMKSAISIVVLQKFKTKFSDDLNFKEKYKNYYLEIVEFVKKLKNANLTDFETLKDISELYCKIINYQVIF
jgi:hypothetical protein